MGEVLAVVEDAQLEVKCPVKGSDSGEFQIAD